MAWSKVKTIIILILLTLNLFLLGLVGYIQLHSARYQAAALREAAAVLERSSIQVDPGILPAEMPLRTVTMTRDTEREAALAAALLGTDTEIRSTAGGLHIYEAAAGNASFRSSGEFSVTFTQPRSLPSGASPLEQVRGILDGLGLEIWQAEEQGSTVAVVQSLDGTPVFPSASTGQSAGASFSFNEAGRLSMVSGRLALGRTAEDPAGQEALTVPTVLIAFFNFILDSGDACHAIYEVLPVYRASSMSDPVSLIPAWRISTDTGDYFLDAATAEVVRAS